MIGRALREGLRSATGRPGLVALLWAWNLVLAVLVTLPFFSWIAGATAGSPATDTLLDGFNLGIIPQLVQANPAGLAGIMAGVGGLMLVSLVSGAFLSGGMLEVLMNEGDDRPLLHRFFRGAGHFFGRFLRLLALAGITAGLVVGVLAAALAAATRPLTGSGSEAAALAGVVAVQVVVGLAVAYFMLALDYARVITVWTGARSMLRAWWRALRFVLGHTPGVAAIGLAAGILVLATSAVTTAFDVSYSARSWSIIVVAILLYQLMAIVRTAVRVGQVSAQATYCCGLLPVAAPVEVSPALPAEPAGTVDTVEPIEPPPDN